MLFQLASGVVVLFRLSSSSICSSISAVVSVYHMKSFTVKSFWALWALWALCGFV